MCVTCSAKTSFFILEGIFYKSEPKNDVSFNPVGREISHV
jgi:hypothetical protein